MDKEKVKSQEKGHLSQYDHNNMHDGKPINDAMDHLNKIEGYPIKKPARLKSLPLPIRIIGYILVGAMVVGALLMLVLNFI